jgi:hypothetical protein
MLLSAVVCAKPLRHRNVNIKLYFLNLIQNKLVIVVVLLQEYTLNNFYETFLTLNKFWRWFTADLIVHWVRRVFFLTLSGISCVTIILDEIERSISISVYYGWKRSIKNGRSREIDLKITFWLQISKYRKQNKQPKRKVVRQIILEINSLDM